jgi:hypothetical protein
VAERIDGGRKATVREDRWMDAACELAQLGDGGPHVFDALGDEGHIFTASLGELQRHNRFYEPLLRSVVKVAYDLPALLVGSLDEPCPRRNQFGLGAGVGDRGSDQLGKG